MTRTSPTAMASGRTRSGDHQLAGWRRVAHAAGLDHDRSVAGGCAGEDHPEGGDHRERDDCDHDPECTAEVAARPGTHDDASLASRSCSASTTRSNVRLAPAACWVHRVAASPAGTAAPASPARVHDRPVGRLSRDLPPAPSWARWSAMLWPIERGCARSGCTRHVRCPQVEAQPVTELAAVARCGDGVPQRQTAGVDHLDLTHDDVARGQVLRHHRCRLRTHLDVEGRRAETIEPDRLGVGHVRARADRAERDDRRYGDPEGHREDRQRGGDASRQMPVVIGRCAVRRCCSGHAGRTSHTNPAVVVRPTASLVSATSKRILKLRLSPVL